MTLTDGQLYINGFTFGDGLNTFLEELTGWDDLPPIDSGNTPRPMTHGSFLGSKYARERIITWTGKLNPQYEDQFSTILAQIRSATTLTNGAEEYEITIRTIDEELKCRGAVTARSIPGNRRYGAGRLADVSFQITCSDPRKYTIDTTNLSIGFPVSGSSGLSYPLVYPLDYGTPIESGFGEYYNSGDAPLPVVITITGPCVGPAVYNETTGTFVKFNITLTAPDYLVIDTSSGTVVLNGTADRLYTRLTSSSPIASMEMIQGTNNIRIAADSWSDTASVTISGSSGAFF